MDVFPALLDNDIPFYSHEIEAYWNDIGNLEELRQGNVDALTGAVAVDPGAAQVSPGVWSAEPVDGVEIEAPVLLGSGVEIGEGARIAGPTVIGDGARSAPAPTCATRSCLTAPSVPPAAMLVGAIGRARSRRSPDSI